MHMPLAAIGHGGQPRMIDSFDFAANQGLVVVEGFLLVFQ